MDAQFISEYFVNGWLIANVVLSVAAGWSYWYNLRSSYVKEAKQANPTAAELTMV
jgi:hypothetical protein